MVPVGDVTTIAVDVGTSCAPVPESRACAALLFAVFVENPIVWLDEPFASGVNPAFNWQFVPVATDDPTAHPLEEADVAAKTPEAVVSGVPVKVRGKLPVSETEIDVLLVCPTLVNGKPMAPNARSKYTTPAAFESAT